MRLSREDGFTITEAIVALVIIFGAVLVMLRSIDSGSRVLSETKRQSAGSAFASELMERARSLEWSNMGLTVDANSANCTEPSSPADPPQGVGCSSFTADFPSEITAISGGYEFGGEPVVFATGSTFDPFLSFHQQVVRDKTVFDRYLFITSVRTDNSDPATEKYRRITAVVRWNAPSGYRREVRLSSYVSPFTEPSQPFISAEVNLDGGFGQIQGRITGIGGWGMDYNTTQDESILLSMPSVRLTATSDYVSVGEARLEGTSGYWTGAGPDGVLGSSSTDDVRLATLDPQVTDLLADDDGTSSAPVNYPISAQIDLTQLNTTEDGVTIAESSGGATLKNHTRILTPGGAAALDSTDDLPHASMEVEGAGRTAMTRVEDWAGDPAQAYIDQASPLGTTAYEFTFYRYGDHDQASAMLMSGQVDRQDVSATGLRKATAQFDWKGEEVDLLDDNVIGSLTPKFRGWVVVGLPGISNEGSVAPLEAGEYYAALTPGIDVKTGDVTIDVWDGNSYTRIFEDYESIANCDSEPLVIDEDFTTSTVGLPQLDYTVKGNVTVNGMCVGSTQQYTSGEVRSNTVSAKSIVIGSISYRVVDKIAAAEFGETTPGSEVKSVLYDLTLTFSAGGVQATAVYINPELS
jgi:type II secretory pathway pseudopilin PulG